MAADTVTIWEAALRQGWTQDSLEKQFLATDPLLDLLEARKPEITIGLEAITPVWTGRGGGYTAVPPTGSRSLNKADAENINRAKWTYKRHWNSIELDTAVIQQSQGSGNAVADVVDTEVEGKISNTRKQLTRQLFNDGTALIAQCEANTAVNTLKLKPTGEYSGFLAVRNGWLPEGQQIDIGTLTEEAVKADKVEITALSDSESEPTITISGSAITTTTSHYVSIANARSGETSYEMNGLRNIAAETGTLGGLAATGQWKGITVNAEEAAINRGQVVSLRRKLRQKGEKPDTFVTSLKQVEALENQLYTQVRFADPGKMNTGTGETVEVGNLQVMGHEDCPDGDFYAFNKDHLSMLRTDKPEWVPQKYGNGKLLQWIPETTFVTSSLEYYCELFTNRRNAIGRIKNLA